MKKYTLAFSIFILSLICFGFLGFYSNSANAANCAPGDLFNSNTGQSCSSTSVVTCPSGNLYSSTTGQRCTAWTNASATAGVGLTIGSRGPAVVAFQQVLLNAGFSPGPIDGIYGLKTDAAAKLYYQTPPPVLPEYPLKSPVTSNDPTPPPSYCVYGIESGSGCFSPDTSSTSDSSTSDLTITTTSLPSGTVGISYSADIDASGGTDTYNWAISSGSLPAGLSLVHASCLAYPCQASATISGTPTAAGSSTFGITLMSKNSMSKTFTINIY